MGVTCLLLLGPFYTIQKKGTKHFEGECTFEMKRKAMIYESLTLEKKHKFISPICKSPKIMMIKHFCSIFKILAIYKTTKQLKTVLSHKLQEF